VIPSGCEQEPKRCCTKEASCKNGNVTLSGVVATKADKDMAGILANGVPGVFAVTNDLVVERSSN
jgi:osmotically-inducible protein OsmY